MKARKPTPRPLPAPGACPCHPPAPATCPACGAGPDVHAPSCALTRAPHLERLLLRVRDELRVIDQATCSTFDGHGVRALLRVVESEVGE